MNDNDLPYTPATFLGWALKSGWKPEVLPVGVIFTFQPTVERWARSSSGPFGVCTDLTVSNAATFMSSDDGPPILLSCLNPGGASMVTQLEHLRFLSNETQFAGIVGTAGSMIGGLNIGDVRVVGTALRSDGISDRYLPPGKEVAGDKAFTEALRERINPHAEAVKTWTVDVPYRMTNTDHEAAVAAKAQVTEMEIASLFAASRCLDLTAAAAVVVSDVSRADGWHSDWSDTAEPLNNAVLSMIHAMRSAATN